jgi:hypothetical protein
MARTSRFARAGWLAASPVCVYHGCVTEAPSDSASSVSCPKCGKRRSAEAESCPRCGLVFALWNADEGAAALRLDATGEELWEKARANWCNAAGHEDFLKHCLQTGTLAAAGRLYRERLDDNPKDALAAQMQNQVLAKATLGLALNKSEPRTAVTRNRWFWVIVLTAMALGIAAGLFWRRLH